MSQDNGGAAFPVPQAKVLMPPDMELYAHDIQVQHNGMTLLDYFAGQVLVGWCSSESTQQGHADIVAKVAYDFAAAMLTERARRTEK